MGEPASKPEVCVADVMGDAIRRRAVGESVHNDAGIAAHSELILARARRATHRPGSHGRRQDGGGDERFRPIRLLPDVSVCVLGKLQQHNVFTYRSVLSCSTHGREYPDAPRELKRLVLRTTLSGGAFE